MSAGRGGVGWGREGNGGEGSGGEGSGGEGPGRAGRPRHRPAAGWQRSVATLDEAAGSLPDSDLDKAAGDPLR